MNTSDDNTPATAPVPYAGPGVHIGPATARALQPGKALEEALARISAAARAGAAPAPVDEAAAITALAAVVRRRLASEPRDEEATTALRAARVEPLLWAWMRANAVSDDDDLGDIETELQDLWTDTMHWARQRGIPVARVLRAAADRHHAEVEEAAAYAAGYRAHGAGEPPERNPHGERGDDAERGAAWCAGWEDAAAGREPREEEGGDGGE